MKYIITLDIIVEADSRAKALEKVEELIRDADSYCLYDAEIVEDNGEQAVVV